MARGRPDPEHAISGERRTEVKNKIGRGESAWTPLESLALEVGGAPGAQPHPSPAGSWVLGLPWLGWTKVDIRGLGQTVCAS